MDESGAIDILISELEHSIEQLKTSPVPDGKCEPHKNATIVLLKCQRANLIQARDATNEARKAGGIIAAIVATIAAALQYFASK